MGLLTLAGEKGSLDVMDSIREVFRGKIIRVGELIASEGKTVYVGVITTRTYPDSTGVIVLPGIHVNTRVMEQYVARNTTDSFTVPCNLLFTKTKKGSTAIQSRAAFYVPGE